MLFRLQGHSDVCKAVFSSPLLQYPCQLVNSLPVLIRLSLLLWLTLSLQVSFTCLLTCYSLTLHAPSCPPSYSPTCYSHLFNHAVHSCGSLTQFTHCLPATLTHSLTAFSLTHTLTHSLTHSLPSQSNPSTQLPLPCPSSSIHTQGVVTDMWQGQSMLTCSCCFTSALLKMRGRDLVPPFCPTTWLASSSGEPSSQMTTACCMKPQFLRLRTAPPPVATTHLVKGISCCSSGETSG